MKKLLLILVLLPLASMAQMEIGVRSGIAPFKISSNDYYTSQNSSNKTSVYSDIFASVNIVKFLKVGVDCGIGSFAFTNTYLSQKSEYTLAKPLFTVSAFADFSKRIKKSALNAGITIGFASINSNNMSGESQKGNALLYGVHIGYSYAITNRISILAQIGLNNLKLNIKSVNYTSPKVDNTLTFYPLQLGLKYRFGK